MNKFTIQESFAISAGAGSGKTIIFINAHHPATRRTKADSPYHQVLDSYHNYKTNYVKDVI